ncbi:MAG: hypothetical protein OEW67_09235 [Cyclobacteriaceae bacterium]|nr:hypothetical protein [Cyclobacteriaceae bacterium]
MNKQKLVNVLKDNKSISSSEISELKSLAKDYPYSQIFHILVAKGSYDHASPNVQQDIQLAAIYATNRALLKSIITKKLTNVSSSSPTIQKPKTTTTSPLSISEGDALRADVLKNLEILIESKKPYQLEESEKSKKTTPVKTKAAIKKPSIKKKKTKSEDEEKKPEPVTEPIDIAGENSKSETSEFNQIDIIDNFIKKQPSISKKAIGKVSTKQPQKDLSESSANFGENLISENLAQILVKQGQNDKAIDIYKKLIWKIPQKKAYFATRIEELKK